MGKLAKKVFYELSDICKSLNVFLKTVITCFKFLSKYLVLYFINKEVQHISEVVNSYFLVNNCFEMVVLRLKFCSVQLVQSEFELTRKHPADKLEKVVNLCTFPLISVTTKQDIKRPMIYNNSFIQKSKNFNPLNLGFRDIVITIRIFCINSFYTFLHIGYSETLKFNN